MEVNDLESSSCPVKSNSSDIGCMSSLSTEVTQNEDEEDCVKHMDSPATQSITASPLSPAIDLHRTTEQAVSSGELAKLAVNLKLNGTVELDEGPLDLSLSRRGTSARSWRPLADYKPEEVFISSRSRSSKSQTFTSTSLARLMKRFGATVSNSTTSTGGTVHTSRGRVVHDAESFTETQSITLPQSMSLFKSLATPHKLPERQATTFSSPPPSRWRRDSFWANGGWLPGATAMSSSSLIAERHDDRKRPRTTTTSGSADNRPQLIDAQPIKLSRKSLFSDHRKSSSHRSARSRCDGKLSTSGSSDSSNRTSKITPRTPSETRKTSCGGSATTTQAKESTPTSPKWTRTGDSHDTATKTELAGKGQDGDDGDGDIVAAVSSVRCNLTSLRCGSCGAQFESLYRLTVHLEETGHTPASDVAVLPIPSPAASPSSSDRKPAATSPASSPPTSAPQRLVRGQDVWLARGVEQTDRILRCIQCNAPARSLAELTLHMVHTKHYINIVGPTTTTTTSNMDIHQRATHPTTLRDKSAEMMMLKAKNGLKIASSKDHTNIRRHNSSCTNIANDDRTTSHQQMSVFAHTSSVPERYVDKNANKDTSRVQDERFAKDSSDLLRTTERGSAFSVRNLIASETEDTRPESAAASRRDGRSMTSVGPQVTSSSDERRGRLSTVAESVSGNDVISA